VSKSIAQRMNRDILVTFAVIAVLFVVLGGLMQWQWKEDNIRTVCRFLDMLVAREQSNIANELFEHRTSALKLRLEEISSLEDILRVELFDEAGHPLASVAKGKTEEEAGLRGLDLARFADADGYNFEHDFSALHFTRAIKAAGETLGWIRISHDLSLLRKQMLNFFSFFFLLLLIALLCMQMILRRRLQHSVVNPLQALSGAMREMDAGTLSQTLQVGEADLEIARLGEAFQELLGRLAASYRELDAAHGALARNERRLSRAIEASTDAVWEWFCKTGVTYFSPRWYTMLDYEDQELPMHYDTWKILCHPEDYIVALAAIEETVESRGEKSYQAEIRMRAKDGSWKWILSRGDVIERDADGSAAVFSGTHTDITARKHAEELLRQSEEKFSRLFRLSPDAILVTHIETRRVMDVNDSFAQLFGYSRQECLGRTLLELGIFTDMDRRAALYSMLRDDGIVRNFELEARHRDGSVLVCSTSSQILDFEDHPCAIGVIRDITQSKKLQEIMIQSEKMLSVGGMAAGIAHEINNPLGIILQASHNIVQRTRADFPKNLEAAERVGLDMELLVGYMRERKLDVFIEDIQAAAVRAAGIIRRMLDFSRLKESGRTMCDIKALVENSLALAGSDYDLRKSYDFKRIELKVDIPADIPCLDCTETEIEQVFLNLLRNAAQAMSSATPPIENPQITIRGRLVENAVRFEFEDNGPGMPPEVSRRIFEPFFTTKAPGLGTGLGLSVSYFIITKSHGGTMRVESAPGLGTRFIIELPLDERA